MVALTSINDLKDPLNLEPGLIILDDIATRMEEQIENAPEDGNHRAGGIHASEVSGCKRRLVYGVLNTERQGKASFIWKRRFSLGHKIHDMIQGEFATFSYSPNHTTKFQAEVKIAPGLQPMADKWDINSSCDGIFEIREKNPARLVLRAGLEIKSMNPDEFSRLTKPKPEHIEQAHVYMACLNLPVMWFIYFNKGNANYTKSSDRRFVIPFDPKLWANLEARFEEVHNIAYLHVANSHALPEREESILCQFCPFSYTCQPKSLNKSQMDNIPKRFMK